MLKYSYVCQQANDNPQPSPSLLIFSPVSLISPLLLLYTLLPFFLLPPVPFRTYWPITSTIIFSLKPHYFSCLFYPNPQFPSKQKSAFSTCPGLFPIIILIIALSLNLLPETILLKRILWVPFNEFLTFFVKT